MEDEDYNREGQLTKPSVYMETSVISRLTSWISKLPTVADEQQTSLVWWENYRNRFDLFISDLVMDEISRGDLAASSSRIQFVQNIRLLTITDKMRNIAKELLTQTALPSKEEQDAIHIACAAVNQIDYLLTWNCKHIANPVQLPKIRKVLQILGLTVPKLMTPKQLINQLKTEEAYSDFR
ncbi:MAG: type II toxin-antitoxin system VapC family toxin [Planctomycetaceae bacterium]|jgi:hypothetical protein|nr:type II toxin-antitoxin system VapC family toxin [Planctomycetaceae bacterium]